MNDRHDNAPRFCRDCTKYASCDLCHDEQLRENCTLLQDNTPLTYRNSEGYADPTTYHALRNVERERRAKRKAEQLRQEPGKASPQTQ